MKTIYPHKMTENHMKRPLKIAYLVSRFPHLYQAFIRREINELTRQGVNITVFPVVDSRRRGEAGVDPDYSVSAPVIYSPFISWRCARTGWFFLRKRPRTCSSLLLTVLKRTWKNPVDLAKSLMIFPRSLSIAAEVKRGRFDHIHAHWATHPTTAALIVSELTGIPFSFAFHACGIFGTRIMLAEKIRKAAFVVNDCRYTLEYVRALYPDESGEKLHLIYNGVDLKEFYRVNPPLADPVPTIIAVGRLVPTKGFTYLLEACRLLKASGRKFKCLIIGSGPQGKQLGRIIARDRLKDTVELVGEASPKKLVEYLARADIFVMPCYLPSRGTHDAIPTVLIEAQAAGVPIVASAVFGIPEIVKNEETGLLVPERDPLALQKALELFMDNPSRARKLADRARAEVEEKINIRTCCELRLSLFRDAVSGFSSS